MKHRYVVAVSGGVDSVVLLHMLAQSSADIVVAHFDHGIRPESADDAAFVAKLARTYNLPFKMAREELGPDASEEHARNRRYTFLKSVAEPLGAHIVTAHHADDVIETVAINTTRGTGWRGLSVMDSGIVRPLLDTSKQEIIDYATAHGLTWREDSTNVSDAYLRNRLRQKLAQMDDDAKRQLLALRAHQIGVKKHIDNEVARFVGNGPTYDRYFFTHIPGSVAVECLRAVTDARLTRPQLERMLVMIKTAKPGTKHHAGAGVEVRFTSRNFTVQLIK